MTSKWTDVATQVVVFDAVKGDEADLLRWKRQVLSALSLLHAVSLASLGGLVSLEVLAGVDSAQVDSGLNHPRLPKHGEFKTAVALQWVQDIITGRIKEGLAVPPPILSRVFQVPACCLQLFIRLESLMLMLILMLVVCCWQLG